MPEFVKYFYMNELKSIDKKTKEIYNKIESISSFKGKLNENMESGSNRISSGIRELFSGGAA